MLDALTCAPWWCICFLLFLCSGVLAQEDHRVLQDSRKLATRPDIEAPRWKITVHDRDKIGPGYWFVSPYDTVEQMDQDKGHWTAPMIFDQAGELIWSGSQYSQGYNTFDFRLSNVLGEDRLTFLRPENKSLVVLDSNLTIHSEVQIANSNNSEIFNFHELNFVNGGTRALVFYEKSKNTTKHQTEDLGGRCLIRENTFREADLTEDWRFVYRWDVSKRIDFAESLATEGTLHQRCNETADGWDWAHANSVDKFEDGSYLLSVKHTRTIYKILRDGDIAWRLGGNQSDFEADFTFSHPNDARIQSHNASHTIISLFDNGASGNGSISASSRGLQVALRIDSQPMTATLLAGYSHPRGSGFHVENYGSVQVIPDGNVFSGWVDGLTISEHSADGSLLMEAHVEQDWLKSYRSYKFPFVGRPTQPPDVHAEIEGQTKTRVYVSWNGATEVASWNVYKARSDGEVDGGPWASAPREGFETMITVDGSLYYVVAEALDKDNQSLGRSKVVETRGISRLSETATPEAGVDAPPNQPDTAAEEPEESSSEAADRPSWKDKATSRGGIGGFLGVVIVIAALFFGMRMWRRRRRSWAAGHRRKASDHELFNWDESRYALEDSDEDSEREYMIDKQSR